MSKHIRVGNKLLDTNKEWRDLKQSQKDWITKSLKESYLSFVVNNQRKPTAVETERIFKKVYDDITEKEIWIPVSEVRVQWNRIRAKVNNAVPNK